MGKSLLHAKHNKEACDYLHKAEGDGFPDWVITTAFYSAIHYVYASTFPFTEGASTFTNFDQYLAVEKRLHNNRTKHEITHDLVRKLHPSIEAWFAQLKSAAHTSRYVDYKQDPKAVTRIRKCLTKVAEYCEKKIEDKAAKDQKKGTDS